MPDVRILVIDNDQLSRRALRLILESDEWQIEMAAQREDGLAHLAKGGWHLVIANVSLSGVSGPLFELLRDLDKSDAKVRTLFLVPAFGEAQVLQTLERMRLPYATLPLHLHDFLENVSDLLHESGAVSGPLRGFREGGPAAPKPHLQDARKRKEEEGAPTMFAARDGYEYDEEELRRFEEEERRKHASESGESDPDSGTG